MAANMDARGGIRSVVVAPKPEETKPAAKPAKPPPVRKEKPHVNVHLDKRVQRIIKEIAFAYDVKAHDLYIEGINLMLKRYGKGTVADIAP
jgi:hypothetical protein